EWKRRAAIIAETQRRASNKKFIPRSTPCGDWQGLKKADNRRPASEASHTPRPGQALQASHFRAPLLLQRPEALATVGAYAVQKCCAATRRKDHSNRQTQRARPAHYSLYSRGWNRPGYLGGERSRIRRRGGESLRW